MPVALVETQVQTSILILGIWQPPITPVSGVQMHFSLFPSYNYMQTNKQTHDIYTQKSPHIYTNINTNKSLRILFRIIRHPLHLFSWEVKKSLLFKIDLWDIGKRLNLSLSVSITLCHFCCLNRCQLQVCHMISDSEEAKR